MEKKLFKDILTITLLTVLCFTVSQHLTIIIKGIQYIFSLFLPFLLGLCIAFVLNVILKKIEILLPIRNHKSKRIISLILTLLLVVSIIIFIVFLIVPELQNTIQLLIANLPTYQEQLINWMEKFDVSKEFINQIQNNWNDITQSTTNFIKENSKKLLNITVGFTSSLISGIFNLVLGIVFAIYILAEKEKYGQQTKKTLYAFLSKTKAEKIINLGSLSHKIFSNFVSGQLVEAVIIGLLCFIGMLILKLPYAPTISVLVGFTALIPVFGAFFGTIIGAVLIFAINPMQSLMFIIFILILQQIEGNFIYSKVIGNSVGLPSIWVMLAVTIGGSMMGIIGMLISVPLCSVLYIIMRNIVSKKLKLKKIEI